MSPKHNPAEGLLGELVAKLGVPAPTAEQSAVIRHPITVEVEGEMVPAPLLVVAGAGSGKTETMSLRAVYIAATTETPDDAILGLTFTRKAAAELETRLSKRLAQLRGSVTRTSDLGLLEFEAAPVATTYNAFALSVVREFGPQLGIRTDFHHLDSAASWQLMHDVVDGWSGPLTSDKEPSTVVEKALSLREDLMNQALSLPEARRRLEKFTGRFTARAAASKRKPTKFFLDGAEANQLRLELLDIIEEFEARKSELGRLDYADQVLLASRIVAELPGARAELRERHKVVFLDEFQDTSVAQMRFLSTLFADHPVTAVGDPNQAIYGWRGASAASLEDFHPTFTRNPLSPRTTMTLSTAWRNSTRILEVANTVSADLRERPRFLEGADPSASGSLGPVLEPRPGAPAGDVEIRYPHTEAEQIEEVVEFLRKNYQHAEQEGLNRPTQAVLCRRRATIGPIIEACRAAGLPAETFGEMALLLHPAVTDHRAALEIANDIGRSSSVLRLVTNLDIGAADLWAVGELASAIARDNPQVEPGAHPPVLLISAIDHLAALAAGETVPKPYDEKVAAITPAARERLAHLGHQLRQIRSHTDRSIEEQVERVRKVLQTEEESLALGLGDEATEVLDAFAAAATEFAAASPRPTMRAFLDWLEITETVDRGLPLPAVEPNPKAVQVLTIHAAKGLEWDAVAVVDLSAGRFPNYRGTTIKLSEDPTGARVARPPASPAATSAWWTDPGNLPYQVRRDAAHLPDPPIWDPDLTATAAGNTFREDAGEYRLLEERRLAYVAFTRPRNHLLLTGSWLTGGKTMRYPSVFIGELDGAADTDPEGEGAPPAHAHISTVPTEAEQEEYTAQTEERTFPPRPGLARKMVALSAAKVNEQLRELQDPGRKITEEELLAAFADQDLAKSALELLAAREEALQEAGIDPEERAAEEVLEAVSVRPKSFSATGLAALGAGGSVWVDLRRPLPEAPLAEAAVGTAFHQWVEGELRRVSATQAETEPAGERTEGTPALTPDAEAVQVALNEEQLRRLQTLQTQFRGLGWLEQWKVEGLEVPFDVEIGGELVRGRVDAVLTRADKDRETTMLVDWKTGWVPTLDPKTEQDAAAIERYLVQLEVYVRAWEDGPGQGSPEAVLVFVGSGGGRQVSRQELKAAHHKYHGQEFELENYLQIRTRPGKKKAQPSSESAR